MIGGNTLFKRPYLSLLRSSVMPLFQWLTMTGTPYVTAFHLQLSAVGLATFGKTAAISVIRTG